MKIDIDLNQAALVTTMEEDGTCTMKVVYDKEYDEYLPYNVQMLFALAELFQNSEEFMSTIGHTINSIFKEPTTH